MQFAVTSAVPHRDHADVAEHDRDGRHRVQRVAGQEPAGVEVAECDHRQCERGERQADAEPHTGHPTVEFDVPRAVQRAHAEQGDADEHHPERTAAELDEQPEPDGVGHLERRFVGPQVGELGAVGTDRRCDGEPGGHGHDEDPDTEADQRAGCPVPQRHDERRGDGIDHQDVALPQEAVQKADAQQQQVAPQAEQHRSAALGPRAVGEQGDAGAEQQREEAHHLLVGEDLAEAADDPVEHRVGPAAVEVEVGRGRHRERHDVHQQDAQRRPPADGVEIGDALGPADRCAASDLGVAHASMAASTSSASSSAGRRAPSASSGSRAIHWPPQPLSAIDR